MPTFIWVWRDLTKLKGNWRGKSMEGLKFEEHQSEHKDQYRNSWNSDETRAKSVIECNICYVKARGPCLNGGVIFSVCCGFYWFWIGAFVAVSTDASVHRINQFAHIWVERLSPSIWIRAVNYLLNLMHLFFIMIWRMSVTSQTSLSWSWRPTCSVTLRQSSILW